MPNDDSFATTYQVSDGRQKQVSLLLEEASGNFFPGDLHREFDAFEGEDNFNLDGK